MGEKPPGKTGNRGSRLQFLPYLIGIGVGLVLVLMLVLNVATKEKAASPNAQGSAERSSTTNQATTPLGTMVMKTTAIGCKDRAVLARFTQLASEGDKQAFADYRTEQLGLGQCMDLMSGTEVHLEDTAGFFATSVCVRPTGDTSCYWVVREAVEFAGTKNATARDDRVNATTELSPGVAPYSLDEAFQMRARCVKGDDNACFELCRRHLNGDRPGYSCPPVSSSPDHVNPTMIVKGAIACAELEDEVFTAEDKEMVEADDNTVRNWIAVNHKDCVLLESDSEVRFIARARVGYYQVAIKSENWRRMWVTGLDFGKFIIDHPDWDGSSGH